MKNRMFLEMPILKAFWMVLGRFCGTRFLDFRIFFIIFSRQNLKCNLEGQKIEKSVQQEAGVVHLGPTSQYVRAWGEGFIGWGEACPSLNFKPYLKIGL